MLPSTAEPQVYEATLDEQHTLRLIDLPGITAKTAPMLLQEMTQSDLVLWVLQANQPARALDVDLRTQVRAWCERQTQRQPPVLLGVLSQVDRLVRAQDDAQALVEESLAHAREQMALDDIVALALPVDAHPHAAAQAFPLRAVRAALQHHHARALNVQLNRRRLHAQEFSARRELQRAVNTGKALLRPTP